MEATGKLGRKLSINTSIGISARVGVGISINVDDGDLGYR